jgi:hypothetical protein
MSNHDAGWVVHAAGGRWTIDVPGYQGVDSMTWWPLSLRRQQDLPGGVEGVSSSMDVYLAGIQPGRPRVCQDPSLITDYLAAPSVPMTVRQTAPGSLLYEGENQRFS